MADHNPDFKHDVKVHDDSGSDAIVGEVRDNADQLHRRLNNRQIQLLAIGGSIGTAIFVSIGSGLNRGGPGSLLIAYLIYSMMLALVNNCIAEMMVLHPVSGGFVRLAGHFVDDAWGTMAGWNFFIYEALLIPFEITAINLVLTFWSTEVPVAAICAACIVLYAYDSPKATSPHATFISGSILIAAIPNASISLPLAPFFSLKQLSLPIAPLLPNMTVEASLINVLAVRAFGEAEFWLSGGKVFLIFIVFGFTFVTMVGGNPDRDAYGFRYWRNPGSFAEYRSTGSLGQFEGFLACLWSASFTVVGPEYIAMAAAETQRPRHYIKTAFKTVYWRFGVFFIVGALCIGIVLPYNDPTLDGILNGGSGGGGTASASPYVIAMNNLRISGLPHVVNALLLTSIFSAGNTYTFCATRTLYGLALEGRAPKILRKCSRNGVPWAAFLVVMLFPFLSFLQVSNGSNRVLNILISLITAGGVINYIVMSSTYIAFYNACKAQGLDRRTFPYFARFQPYCAYIGLAWMVMIVFFYGYASFSPFTIEGFFSNYTMHIIAVVIFSSWKLLKKTKFVKPLEADLVWERPIVDAYEAKMDELEGEPTGFWKEMFDLFTFNLFNKKARKANREARLRRREEGRGGLKKRLGF